MDPLDLFGHIWTHLGQFGPVFLPFSTVFQAILIVLITVDSVLIGGIRGTE